MPLATVPQIRSNDQDGRCAGSLIQPTEEVVDNGQSKSSLSESHKYSEMTESGPKDADKAQYENLYKLESKSKTSYWQWDKYGKANTQVNKENKDYVRCSY